MAAAKRVRAARGREPRGGARGERSARLGARAPRLRRRRSRREPSSRRSCPRTIRSSSATCARRARRSARRSRPGRGSASTATTTPTASARPRSRCSSCASSARRSTYHLPSRFDEGYGVAGETLTRLAGEGIGLVLTVDCGVTAVEEVAHARELGLDVVVTDHHRPGEELPACPVVGPYRGDYPFRELCGTGVVWKLGQALLGADSEALARHLDLVAVATVADVVPLAGREPRPRGRRPALARADAEAGPAGADARRARRPGGGRRGHDRLPARAEAERGRPAGEAGGRARAAADRGARARPPRSRSSSRS